MQKKRKFVERSLRFSATRIQHSLIIELVMQLGQKTKIPLNFGVGGGVGPPPPSTHGAQKTVHAI